MVVWICKWTEMFYKFVIIFMYNARHNVILVLDDNNNLPVLTLIPTCMYVSLCMPHILYMSNTCIDAMIPVQHSHLLIVMLYRRQDSQIYAAIIMSTMSKSCSRSKYICCARKIVKWGVPSFMATALIFIATSHAWMSLLIAYMHSMWSSSQVNVKHAKPARN